MSDGRRRLHIADGHQDILAVVVAVVEDVVTGEESPCPEVSKYHRSQGSSVEQIHRWSRRKSVHEKGSVTRGENEGWVIIGS